MNSQPITPQLPDQNAASGSSTVPAVSKPACPVCGAALFEQRAKLICTRCRTVCETCCEGGPG